MSVNYHAYQSRGVPFSEYEAVSEQWRQMFAGYDPERIAKLLKLEYDENYLYLSYFRRLYRLRLVDGYLEKQGAAGESGGSALSEKQCVSGKFGRAVRTGIPEKQGAAGEFGGAVRTGMPENQCVPGRLGAAARTSMAGPDRAVDFWTEELYFNESMAIYHLLYYTKDMPVIAGVWVPAHTVDGVVSRNPLAKDPLLDSFCRRWTGQAGELASVCRRLGGEEGAGGDAAFTFEAFPCLRLRLIFWDADEDFPAQLQVQVDQRVTDFVHYETVGCITSDLLEMLECV